MSAWVIVETLQEWNTLCSYPDRADHVPGWDCPHPLLVLARRPNVTTVEVVQVPDALALVAAAFEMKCNAAIEISKRDQEIATLKNKLAAVRAMVSDPK